MTARIQLMTFGFVLALLSPAFAQPVAGGTVPTSSAMPGMASPADQAMMHGMQTMQSEMSAVPLTGNADKDFVAMMLPHHQGAVAMAEVELKYGKDPAILKLARAIVAAQDREIAEMKAWQNKHAN